MADCLMGYCVPARVALAAMGFLMFLVTQMIRVNLYIALVHIKEERLANNTNSQMSDHWDENASGILLSSLYWSYWATELPGGLLAQKFGGRNVLGLSVTLAGVLNLVLPVAINSHYLFAAGIRVLQGLCLGATWPAMHWLSARWIPSTERSKFMTVYHGAAIGSAITYPLSGLVILYLGWPWVFYSTGIITIMWSLAWWLYVYDSPDAHPRITPKEKKYLQEQIGELVTHKGKNVKTPWREILHSMPFWGVLMASQGLMCGTITLSMQTPPYFKQIHRLDIETIGYFSGIPEVCKFFFSVFYSWLTDNIFLKKKLMSLTIARKLAVCVCELLPALLLILLALYGDSDASLALTLLALTSAVGGASASGSLANIVDLSPNHAGTIIGLIKTLTVIPGVVSPLVATHLTRPGVDPVQGWRAVLLLTALVYGLCCVSFQFCGSAKVQPWNQKKEEVKVQDLEVLTPLQNTAHVEGQKAVE